MENPVTRSRRRWSTVRKAQILGAIVGLGLVFVDPIVLLVCSLLIGLGLEPFARLLFFVWVKLSWPTLEIPKRLLSEEYLAAHDTIRVGLVIILSVVFYAVVGTVIGYTVSFAGWVKSKWQFLVGSERAGPLQEAQSPEVQEAAAPPDTRATKEKPKPGVPHP